VTVITESSHPIGGRRTTVRASRTGMAYKIDPPDSRQIDQFRSASMTDLRGWKPVSLADDDDEEEGDDSDDEDEDE
jgi:hypothetical protein